MGYLPERKSRTIFVTGSTIAKDGKPRNIVIESRPEFAIVTLEGTKEQYPLAWEAIYEVAAKHDAANMRLENSTAVHAPKAPKLR